MGVRGYPTMPGQCTPKTRADVHKSRIFMENLLGMVENSALHGDGYWNACLTSRQPVIRNQSPGLGTSAAANIDLLYRDLTLPVYDGDKIVAVILVGNRTTDYNTKDSTALQNLAHIMWRVVIRKKLYDETPDQPR